MGHTILMMAGRTVESGAGPRWEALIPAAAALLAILVCVYGPRRLAGWLDRRRESRLTQQAVDDAFDHAYGRERLASLVEDVRAREDGEAV
jgi:hypothetical protein